MYRTGAGPARRTLWYVAWALLGAVQGGVPQCSTSVVACLSRGNVTFDSDCDRSGWQQRDRCTLGCPLSLRIHSPDSLQGMWLCGTPDNFIPYYPEASMDEAHPLNNVELRLTTPALSAMGCALSDYELSHNHSGTIVIVLRGGCKFSQKIEVMNALGAAAGVVVDSQLTPSLLSQGVIMVGTRATARIPAMMVPQHTGAVLLHALAGGAAVHAAVRFRCGGDTDPALALPPPYRYACPNARLVGLCRSARVAADQLCTSCPLLYDSGDADAVCLWGSDLYPHAAANHLAGQPGSLYPTLPARLREALVLVSADVDLCSRQTHVTLAHDSGPAGRILVASVPTAGCLAYHVAWHASQAGLRAVLFVASQHDGGVPSIEGSSRVVEIPVHALSLNDSAILRELFAAKGNITLLGDVPVTLLADGGGATLREPPVDVPEASSSTPSPGVGGGGGGAYVPVVHDDHAEEAMTQRVLITCSVLISVMCLFLVFILRRGLKADVRLRRKIEELGVPNNQMSAAAASVGTAPLCRVRIPLRLATLGFVAFLLVWMVVATYMAAMQAGTKALDTSRRDGEAAAFELHESARERVVNLTMVVTSESLRSAAVFVAGQMNAAEMLATLLTGLYIDLDDTWASFDAQYDRFITLLRGWSPASGVQTSVISTNGFFAGRTLYTDWEHQTASGAFVNETNNGYLHPIAGQLYSTLTQRNVAAARQFPVGTGPLYQLGSAPGDPHALTAGRPRGFKVWLLSIESFPLPSTGSDSGLPKQPVTVSSPIFNRKGAFVGTVSVWVEIASLRAILIALAAQASHFDPTYALVDVREGKVLATNVGPSVTVPLRQWSTNGMFLALDCVPLHRIADVPLVAAHGYLTRRGTRRLDTALEPPPQPPSEASPPAGGVGVRSVGTGDGDGDEDVMTWTTLSTDEHSPIKSMWSAGYDAADFFTDPGYVLMHLRLRPAADATTPLQLEDASGNLWDSEVRGAPGGTPEAESFERFEDRGVVSLSGSAEHAWLIYRNLTTDLPRVQAAAAAGNPLFAPSSSVGRGRRCVSANGKCAWREDVVGVGIESRTVLLRVHPLAAYGGPVAGNDPTLFADVETGIPFLRVQAAGRMLVGDRRFVCETATPAAGVLPPHEWSVVAAVYEVNRQCSFYVNGVLISRVGARPVSGEILLSQGPLVVGRGFHGRISDVVVLNRTLSDQDVAKVGRAGVPEDLHARQSVPSELWVASGGRITKAIDGGKGGGTCLEIVSLVKRATILRAIEAERDAAFRRFDESNERTEDELLWQGLRLRLILGTLVLGALCIYSVFDDAMLRHLQCIASVLIDASVMRLYGYTMMSSPLHELDAMHRALTALMLNLQQYRPYLPDALFGGSGCLLQHPDKESLDPGARTGAVAVLFTDVRNSTELWEAMPNTMPAALRVHNEVVRACLKKTEGYEVKTIGDSFMIAFTSPTEACRFALRLQLELYRAPWPAALCQHHLCRTDETRQQNGLMIRIGINYGHVDIDSNPITKRSDYFGPVVNKASRIEGCGITGAVTISEDVLSELLIEADSRPPSSIWDPDATDDSAVARGARGGLGCGGSTGELSVHTYSSDGAASNPLTAREVLSRAGGIEPSDLQSLSTPYVTPMRNIELRGVDGPNLLFVLLPRALHLRTRAVRQEIEHFSEVRAYKQSCVDDAATCSSDGSGGGGGIGARRGSNSSSLGSRSSASASAPSDCFDLQKQTQGRMRRKGNAAVARTDITLLAFSADPQEALRLHEPLSRIFTSIERTDGSIISVVGSSIFSAWNTLKPCADPTDQSLRYCRVLRGSRPDYRSAYAVGLASGPVLYGPFGTQLQKFITTFGPCVALASSLCLAAQHLDTLALVLPTSFVATVENLKEMAQSQRTLAARRPLEKMAVRGRQLMVFELKADAEDANATAHFMSPFDADGSVGSGKRRASEVPKPPPWGWSEEYLHAFLDGDHETIRRMASQNDPILERVADAMQGKFSLVQYPRFSERTRDAI